MPKSVRQPVVWAACISSVLAVSYYLDFSSNCLLVAANNAESSPSLATTPALATAAGNVQSTPQVTNAPALVAPSPSLTATANVARAAPASVSAAPATNRAPPSSEASAANGSTLPGTEAPLSKTSAAARCGFSQADTGRARVAGREDASGPSAFISPCVCAASRLQPPTIESIAWCRLFGFRESRSVITRL